MLVLRGLDMKSAKVDPTPLDRSHYLGWGHLLTGNNVISQNVSGAVSFDVVVADRIGGATPIPYSLHGIPHDEGQSPVSWLSGGVAAKAEIRPDRAFTKLFAGLNVDPAEQARIAKRKSVLDYVKDSIARTSCQLGATDKARLDQHLTSIRDVEDRLGLTGKSGAMCGVPSNPGSRPLVPADWRCAPLAAFHGVCLRSDARWERSSTRTWRGGTPTWAGISNSHHELSHRQDADGLAMIAAINAWYAEELAKFVDQLTVYEDAAGVPLIENTCIVWVSECGFPGFEHIGDMNRSVNLTAVVLGDAGGVLKTNQMLDLSGTPHQNLWVELINAVSPSSLTPVTTFGNPNTCTGGIAKIRA
ncbi:MAG: DUF1552 domain-containing protein [Polyangiales bacterium]